CRESTIGAFPPNAASLSGSLDASLPCACDSATTRRLQEAEVPVRACPANPRNEIDICCATRPPTGASHTLGFGFGIVSPDCAEGRARNARGQLCGNCTSCSPQLPEWECVYRDSIQVSRPGDGMA